MRGVKINRERLSEGVSLWVFILIGVMIGPCVETFGQSTNSLASHLQLQLQPPPGWRTNQHPSVVVASSAVLGRRKHQMVTRLPDEVGPNHRTWNLAASEAGLPAPGSVTGRTNLPGVWGTPDKHRVVEMATGMHYWNGGAWVPSDPSFDSVPAGFSTSRLQYQVSLSLDICNPAGAVSVMTRDGIQLKSTPAAICLFDSASGNSLVIATITNSVGVLASNNVVILSQRVQGEWCGGRRDFPNRARLFRAGRGFSDEAQSG